ncbi:type II secretion system major pseudopilin GspG [Marinomonas sp. C1424]|uniref:Type II secretion system core protein G n=2 Tax=Marinomonas transparens TaxID=2795388 RepID=A0A934JXK5_9GAMM|nr:type II secretion system major pseudopilin GspG [Marinomonas transparens]
MTQTPVAEKQIDRAATSQEALVLGAKSGQQGFTLLEMMIVLVILGFLVGMIAPNLLSRADDAKVSVTKAQMRDVVTSLNLYKLDNGSFPSTAQGLQALVSEPSGFPEAKNWKKGGYLPKQPQDSWGNEFIYISPGSSGNYDLLSLGADNAEGGEDDAADIAATDLQ